MGLTGEQAYGLAQADVSSVASGFDHATRTGDNTFSIFFIDGSKIDLTIPLPSNGTDGKDGINGVDGADGISIVDARQVDTKHFVCVLSDGTETEAVEMPCGGSVDISKAEGNALVEKEDGLYVGASAVEISKAQDNAIEEKSDGLYVKKTSDVEISKKENNQLTKETDGLFVAPTDTSNLVEKEEGKSLVSDTDITQITTNKTDLELLMADDETTDSVRNLIKRAVEGTLHLTKEVIDHKPTVEEAKDEVLYLVPTEKEGVYKQYTKVGDAIVDLDNTEIDLSGYVQNTFPSGDNFYLDEKDGVKGYNTSPTRGADTFIPFKRGTLNIIERIFPDTGQYTIDTPSKAKKVIWFNTTSGSAQIIYDEDVSVSKYFYGATITYGTKDIGKGNDIEAINDNDVKIKTDKSNVKCIVLY